MTYPNAYKGVNQIYKAEIIAIIAALCTGIGACLAIFGVGAANVGSEAVGEGFVIGGGLLIIATAMLMIVSYVLNIIGVGNAAKDEEAFKSAMVAIIVGIIATLVAVVFSKSLFIAAIAQFVNRVCEILVFWFCVGGIRNLAVRLQARGMVAKADSFVRLIVGLYIASILLSLLGTFIRFGNVMTGIITMVGAGCSIIAYLSYLSLLRGARDMLAR